MPTLAELPRELHALMASFAGTGPAGAALRALAGDAEDWSVTTDATGVTLTRRNGLLHSRHDKPSVDSPPTKWRWGTCWWWHRNGLLHRDGGLPAVKAGRLRAWYQFGKRHRDGGLPAVKRGFDGDNRDDEYWVNGERLLTSWNGSQHVFVPRVYVRYD